MFVTHVCTDSGVRAVPKIFTDGNLGSQVYRGSSEMGSGKAPAYHTGTCTRTITIGRQMEQGQRMIGNSFKFVIRMAYLAL